MKKIIYSIATLLSLTGLIVCIFFKSSYYNFNPSNVKKNIEYLSSEELKGRLSGSSENERVANEIEGLFKELNLKPLNNEYKQIFNVNAPIFTGGTPTLKLLAGESVVQEFKLGDEFKEDMLNFKTTSIQFTKNDKYDIYKSGFAFHKNNETYFFTSNLNKESSFRSSFWNEAPYSFVIEINIDTFNAILDGIRMGYTLDVSLPYKVEEKTIYNVCGMIEGTSKDLPPLVFTAHFDHLGADSLGTVYSGALDNASGTAFLFELAKTFSTLRLPERDIIFVALNAEEFGLLGSKAFADKYKDELSGAEIINFDMVGCEDYPITMMSSASNLDKTTPLIDSLIEICNNFDIENKVTYQDSSDHASFCNDGFDSLTLSHSNTTNIHTPNDTVDKISTRGISQVYEVVECKTIDYAYNNIILIFYNSKTLILFALTSIALLLIGLVKLKHIVIKDEDLSA